MAETENLEEKEQKPEPEINTEELTEAFENADEQQQETPAALPDKKTETYVDISRKGIHLVKAAKAEPYQNCKHKKTFKVTLIICRDCGKIVTGGENSK